LGGLVVVRGHHQHGIGAVVAGALGEFQYVLGVVGAGSGNDGHTARHPLHGEADDFLPLLGGQGGAFAGGAHGHQGVDALLQLEVDETGQGVIVHAGGGHGRYHSGGNAPEDQVFHRNFSSCKEYICLPPNGGSGDKGRNVPPAGRILFPDS